MFQKFYGLLIVAVVFLFILGCSSPPAQSPQDLPLGTTVSGNLRTEAEQWFRVRPTQTGFVALETSGSTDTYLKAYDSSNNFIDEDDDSGEEYNARLEIYVEANRTYLFSLRAFDESVSGPYEIRASYRPIPQARALPFGITLPGNLSAREDQWYSVRPSEPGYVVVETFGDIDTYLTAYNASYSPIDKNDDGGDNLNARLEFFAEANKTYLFSLKSSDGGPYQIRSNYEPIPQDTERNTDRSRSVSLTLGEAIPVWFHSPSESRWYRYTLSRAGTTAFIVQTRGTMDTLLYLYDTQGSLIAEDDDSGDDGNGNALISQRLNAGTYYIEVKAYSDDVVIGRCTLHAETR